MRSYSYKQELEDLEDLYWAAILGLLSWGRSPRQKKIAWRS